MSEATDLEPVTEAHIQSFSDNHDPQSGCPLFTVLPGEIRNTIFALTLRQYYDKNAMYKTTEYYSKPGYRAPLRIDTALLRTCRKIFLETRFLPMQQYVHAFWRHQRPEAVVRGKPAQHITNTVPVALRPHMNTIQIFTHIPWLEEWFPHECMWLSDLSLPQRLKITVRQSDWWEWEDNRPPKMEFAWIAGLHPHKGLCEFVLDLETIERDKTQMLAIVDEIKTMDIELSNGNRLTTGGEIQLEQREESHMLGQYAYDKPSATWLRIPENPGSQESAIGDEDCDCGTTCEDHSRLVYWVATLVWKA